MQSECLYAMVTYHRPDGKIHDAGVFGGVEKVKDYVDQLEHCLLKSLSSNETLTRVDHPPTSPEVLKSIWFREVGGLAFDKSDLVITQPGVLFGTSTEIHSVQVRLLPLNPAFREEHLPSERITTAIQQIFDRLNDE